MPTLLTSEDYPAIRAAIDTSFDEDDLPDEVVELSIFFNLGQFDVLKIDPDAEDRVDDELIKVKAAACYYVAARIVLGVPDLIGETFGTEIYKRSPTDRMNQATLLTNLANSILDDVLGLPKGSQPTTFDRACGTRGRLTSRVPLLPTEFPWGLS